MKHLKVSSDFASHLNYGPKERLIMFKRAVCEMCIPTDLAFKRHIHHHIKMLSADEELYSG